MSDEIFADLPPPPPFPAPPTPQDELLRQRRLSDQGKTLIRQSLIALETAASTSSSPRLSLAGGHRGSNAEVFTFDKPDAPLPPSPKKVLPAAVNESYHAEVLSSDEDDLDVAETHLVRVPRTAEARMELVTTERPFMPLSVPIRNPIDATLIVPDAPKIFNNEAFVEIYVWRNEVAPSTSSPVDAIRRSIRLSRRSLTTSAADAISSALSPSHDSAENGRRSQYLKKKMSEKRLSEFTEADKEAQKQREMIRLGASSDYTMFNRDWSVLLRGHRSTAHWTQLRNRQKHSEIAIYAGELPEPVATLKAGARASRLLMLERASDGGTVYTIAKEKLGAYRVFWICEGRKPSGIVDPEECKFLLVIRKGRILVKCRGESSAGRFQQPTFSTTFTTTVLDMVDKPGKSTSCKIASGMDLVLAFACMIIADRFEQYSCFVPDERTRAGQLHGRFETDVGDEEIDAFHKSVRGFASAGPDNLIY